LNRGQHRQFRNLARLPVITVAAVVANEEAAGLLMVVAAAVEMETGMAMAMAMAGTVNRLILFSALERFFPLALSA
jgi:hypothetical protein